MKPSLPSMARWLAVVVGGVVYSVLAHYSTTPSAAAHFPSLGVAVSLAPALTLLAWLTWRARQRLVLIIFCIAAVTLLWIYWAALQRNVNWVYFLQHIGTNLMLAAVFGTTLLPHKKALVTHLAELVHRTDLAPEVIRYTRQVTLAWTLFFLGMSLISCVLFSLADISIWSIFVNFLSFPLIVMMFGLEYGIRLRKLPHLERHSIMDGIRAFNNSGSKGTPSDHS